MPKQYLQYIAFDRSLYAKKTMANKVNVQSRYANVALVDQMHGIDKNASIGECSYDCKPY
jgi:hypothetical protein